MKKKQIVLPDTRDPKETREIDWLISASRVVLAQARCQHFVDMMIVPEIAEQKDKNPHYVLVKTTAPINSESIASPKEPIRRTLCRIHHLYSANLLFAYLIVIPNGVVTVRKNSVSIVRNSTKDAVKFSDVSMVFQDNNLSLFHSDDGAALICFSEHFSNLPADILKGSMT